MNAKRTHFRLTHDFYNENFNLSLFSFLFRHYST